MKKRPLTTLILAAGEGARMRSSQPKVLHEIAGLALVGHVVRAALQAGSDMIGVIIGPGGQDVARAVQAIAPGAHIIIQKERRGTAHAVLQAQSLIEKAKGDLIIAYGDTPLLRAKTFQPLREILAKGADLAIGAFETAQPSGYGRLIRKGKKITAIREEKDATQAERKIKLVNGGLMGFSAKSALKLLAQVKNSNKAREYYLTDCAAIACAKSLRVETALINEEDMLGVNTRAQLAEAEQRMQQRLRRQALEGGVTLTAPETVFLSYD